MSYLVWAGFASVCVRRATFLHMLDLIPAKIRTRTFDVLVTIRLQHPSEMAFGFCGCLRFCGGVRCATCPNSFIEFCFVLRSDRFLMHSGVSARDGVHFCVCLALVFRLYPPTLCT